VRCTARQEGAGLLNYRDFNCNILEKRTMTKKGHHHFETTVECSETPGYAYVTWTACCSTVFIYQIYHFYFYQISCCAVKLRSFVSFLSHVKETFGFIIVLFLLPCSTCTTVQGNSL